MILVLRNSDARVFRPDLPPHYSPGDAAAAILGSIDEGHDSFPFIEVRHADRYWWDWRGEWIDTGETWRGSLGEFRIVRDWELINTDPE